MSINKKNPDYSKITYDDILKCKNISDEMVDKEFKKLKKLDNNKNTRSFCGNKIIYNYVFENMLNTKRDTKNYFTLKEIFEDEDKKKYWINQTIKMNRRKKLEYIEPVDIYECHRLCKGSINTFKSDNHKYILHRLSGLVCAHLNWSFCASVIISECIKIYYMLCSKETFIVP